MEDSLGWKSDMRINSEDGAMRQVHIDGSTVEMNLHTAGMEMIQES